MRGKNQREEEVSGVDRSKKKKTDISVEVRTSSIPVNADKEPRNDFLNEKCCEKLAKIRDESCAPLMHFFIKHMRIIRCQRKKKSQGWGGGGGAQEEGKPDWLLRLQREHLWQMLWLQTQWLE